MPHRRRGQSISPLAALALCVLPAILLVRCGLWPTFPDYNADASTDGRTDAVSSDGRDGSGDGMTPSDGGMDSQADTSMSTDGGFRACMAAPPSGPFTYERLSSMAMAIGGARDLAFDGRGRLWTVAAQVHSLDPMGMATALTTMAVNGLSLRFVANGDLAITANSATEGGSIKFVDSMGMARTAAMGLRLPQSLVVDASGAVYFTDSIQAAVYRLAPGASMPVELTRDIPTPTGIAITPDFTRLFVGSSSTSRIYFINLDTSGMAIGVPERYVDGSPNLSASGLAFDECGYLYASDRPRGRIVRIPPGGGSMVEIASDMSLLPIGLAFGQGSGFDTRSLYVVDSGRGEVYRLNVGAAGARIVMPSM